jgi:hypothetical protein
MQILIGGLGSTKEGVGETSGQTAGSEFRGVRFEKILPAEETSFLRSVRIPWSAVSPGRKPSVKSGPDVFADALVPGTSSFPERPRSLAESSRLFLPGRVSAGVGSPSLNDRWEEISDHFGCIWSIVPGP